jgi:pyrophosphatase PpaX
MNTKINKYNYFLFDWDGCLARTLDIWLDAYKQVFAEYDMYPSDEVITEKIFGGWDNPKKLGITDIDTYTKKLLKIVNEKSKTVPLYPNAIETLKTLKNRNKKIALITTSTRRLIEPPLKYHKITEFFDLILTTDDLAEDKPNPKLSKVALETLKGRKEEAVIIGDSKKDLMLAINSNIDSILFYPEEHNLFYDIEKLKAYNPTHIIKNLSEII